MSLFRFVFVMAILVLYALANAIHENVRISGKDWMSYQRQTQVQKVNGVAVTGQDLMRLRLSSPQTGPVFLASSPAAESRGSQIPSR